MAASFATLNETSGTVAEFPTTMGTMTGELLLNLTTGDVTMDKTNGWADALLTYERMAPGDLLQAMM